MKIKPTIVKAKPNKKSIYKLPASKKFYIVILKDIDIINDDLYLIKQTKNIRNFVHKHHHKEKFIIISYFTSDNEINDFHEFDKYRSKSFSNGYNITDTVSFLEEFQSIYCLQKHEIIINSVNTNLKCKKCKICPQSNVDLFVHLKSCESYQYTLFGEDIPKHLYRCSRVINNNFNVTYNYSVSLRRTGDYIREHLCEDEKLRILESIDKVGEMVKKHSEFPEISGNVIVKNTSYYNGVCKVFNGKEFVPKSNKEAFYYYVLDQLDSLDYMAFDLKDDRITRRLEKYDDFIRKNDKNLRETIQRTIVQVRDLLRS